jgi:light-regulated signal transduction histidine kinase (bacteriophytochrome)
MMANVQVLKDQVEGRAMHMSKQLRVYHKDGSLHWFQVTTSNHLADPAIGAMVTNFRDVTDTIKAAQELEELNHALEDKVEQRTQQLKEANKALESFSYMVAHDLQSPLRIQSGYADLLKDKYASVLGEEGCGMLDAVIANTMQMRKLVTDLLGFSRINHVALKKEAVDMSEMARSISDTVLKNSLHPAEISIGDLGSSFCDPDLIRQVWTNLISNAIKYSSKNPKPHIEIGSMIQNDEKIYFVRDNGVGFDQAHAARLFMVFQRLHSEAEFQGSGIGLVIVNNILKRHNGKIWAEGEVDKGATFYFTLPE